MVVRRKTAPAAARKAPAKKVAPKAAPVREARLARPAPKKVATTKAAPAKTDVSVYAEKPASDYHKAFARWIVQEVGYDPSTASSTKAAFLRGVSIATAARPAFMNSDFLEEWRASQGIAKRGPKPATEVAETKRRANRSVVSDEEFEDADEVDEDEELEDEEDDEDEDFDEESDDEDEEDEDEDFDEEDDDEEDEEEEVEEAPKRRGRPAAKKAAPAKRAPAKKAAPAKTTRRKAAPVDDEEFIF